VLSITLVGKVERLHAISTETGLNWSGEPSEDLAGALGCMEQKRASR
jgi:hypothetical protein